MAICVTGCSSLRRLSSPAFMLQAKDEPISSFHWTTYVGISHDRAYLQYGRMPFIGKTPRTIVYCPPLSKLSDDIVKQLKAGGPPWKPSTTPTQSNGIGIDLKK